MTLSEIPPWLQVTPRDFVAAGTAGAEAGLGAARTALEAKSISDRAAMESARLSSQERISTMEMQARQEIAEQNRMREDQKLAIENAYRTAQIGLGRQRVEEAQALAEAKAKSAAAKFSNEQGFAHSVLSGDPIPLAYSKFPVDSSVVNAFTRATKKPGEARFVGVDEASAPPHVVQPSGNVVFVPGGRPEHLTFSNQLQKESAIARLRRDKSNLVLPRDREQADAIDAQIETIKNIGVTPGNETITPPPGMGTVPAGQRPWDLPGISPSDAMLAPPMTEEGTAEPSSPASGGNRYKYNRDTGELVPVK